MATRGAAWLASLGLCLVAGSLSASPPATDWENPAFGSVEESVAAAVELLRGSEEQSAPARLFVLFNLGDEDAPGDPRFAGWARQDLDGFLVTVPRRLFDTGPMRPLLEEFLDEVSDSHGTIRSRTSIFGFPELRGLVYLRVVADLDGVPQGPGSAEPEAVTGGLTWYGRYVLVPLLYLSSDGLAELKRVHAADPGAFSEALERIRRDSRRTLRATFRHELVHVHLNTALGTQRYRDMRRVPLWFHEGAAIYLSGQGRGDLSRVYRTYQGAMVYLLQRFGLAELREFFAATISAGEVAGPLEKTYGIAGDRELFRRAALWDRVDGIFTNSLWVLFGVALIGRFLGQRIPLARVALALVALALLVGAATGTAEYVAGLQGEGHVWGLKVLLVLTSLALAGAAVRSRNAPGA